MFTASTYYSPWWLCGQLSIVVWDFGSWTESFLLEATGRASTDLGLSDEDPVVLLAGEVALPLHGAIVLPFGLVEDDAHPLPRGEEGGADVGHGATLALPDHLHHGADLGREETDRCYSLSLNIYIWQMIGNGAVPIYLGGFTALHCSCAAHFADQRAGQLQEERKQ